MAQKIQIRKVELPPESLLVGTSPHYVDSFEGAVQDPENTVDLLAVVKAFWTSAPGWIGKLMNLRNKLVGALGLKTGKGQPDPEEVFRNFKGEPGERVGLFKVYEKAEDELVMGEDDKHLDFRVSMLLKKGQERRKELTISTTVHYQNALGKVYFFFVKPFHKRVVSAMMRGIIRELETSEIVSA